VSKLDQIEPGKMYIKRLYIPVIMSNYVRSYLSKEFSNNKIDGFGIVPEIDISFGDRKYTYTIPRSKRFQAKPFDFL
ncbi:MAG: hypothetical protein PHX62_01765, partial [Bacilli bacterium]|nr:hypothetical protein [Bacilli bacterium]